MSVGREKAPQPLSPELAEKARSIIFWSFFISQGHAGLQKNILQYAIECNRKLVALLDHIHIDIISGDIVYSNDFVNMINDPLHARVLSYTQSPAHKRVDKLVEEDLFGIQYQNTKGTTRIIESSTSGNQMLQFINKLRLFRSSQKRELKSQKQYLEKLIAYAIVGRDLGYLEQVDTMRKKQGSSRSFFTDIYLSHICYFGFLQKPLPADMPECYRELYRRIPRILIQSDEQRDVVKRVVTLYNEHHPAEQVPQWDVLVKQFGSRG